MPFKLATAQTKQFLLSIEFNSFGTGCPTRLSASWPMQLHQQLSEQLRLPWRGWNPQNPDIGSVCFDEVLCDLHNQTSSLWSCHCAGLVSVTSKSSFLANVHCCFVVRANPVQNDAFTIQIKYTEITLTRALRDFHPVNRQVCPV